jgi:hypothetical protein
MGLSSRSPHLGFVWPDGGRRGDREPPGRAYFRLNSRKRIKFNRSCAAPLELDCRPRI